MKRLTRLMQLGVTGAVIITAAASVGAQGRDFAGSWVLDTEKSATKNGPSQAVITQTAREFTARFGDEKAPAMPFNLDGSERIVEGRGTDGRMTTKAVWNGDKLVATVTTAPRPAGEPASPGPQSVTFSREGAWLVLEANTPDHGPMKLYFKKAPAR